MAGREAVRRRHSLQAMRSRSSDSVPVPRPRGANCGCPWLPGSARVSTTAHARAPKIPSTSLSVVPFLAGLLPTAAPGTTADGTAGNVFLSVSPRAIAPHRSTSPSPDSTPGSPPLAPPLPPQPGQPTSGSGRPISSRCHAVEQLDLDTVEPVASRRRHWRDVRRAMRRVLAMPRRHGGAWSMEQGGMEPCWPASRPWGALARASALDHSA